MKTLFEHDEMRSAHARAHAHSLHPMEQQGREVAKAGAALLQQVVSLPLSTAEDEGMQGGEEATDTFYNGFSGNLARTMGGASGDKVTSTVLPELSPNTKARRENERLERKYARKGAVRGQVGGRAPRPRPNDPRQEALDKFRAGGASDEAFAANYRKYNMRR